jgi:hypothetical protein
MELDPPADELPAEELPVAQPAVSSSSNRIVRQIVSRIGFSGR